MTSIIFLLLLIPILVFFIFKNIRQSVSTPTRIAEFIFITLFVLSLLLFSFIWALNSADYYTPIDIVDGGYSPFASQHILTLLVFFGLSIWAIFALWLKGNKLPPVLLVLSLVFLTIGTAISFAVLLQVSSNTEANDISIFLVPLPASYILISIVLGFKIVRNEVEISSARMYKNKFLNYLNAQMAKTSLQPVWVLALLVPVFILVVSILILFGQDYNSITKVFTETTTWQFSQKTHPPFLDHKGHYLCTVAVCGNPKVVKPLRLGKRHGHEIVVNRQLLIANAFEELIQETAPHLHKMIRNSYDKYGYPLSKKITTPESSNLVYRLMKPLEYFFLLVLYCCCSKPEEKINKQYSI
ncbi:DUF6688 domain-containing protein [Pedobacter punctiformis]|uniref:Uncharacterized protein n=1 Tax=Pedobacter punctiformis TaxID=3004097 RepID=A0ABT4L5R0_9SPHI|nr:DUF6688 family protein [Pedobacter sp. HCMS5-2]MCZ4243256.1 hypothetical protein [Pedobacter sp. HCMS5-2]